MKLVKVQRLRRGIQYKFWGKRYLTPTSTVSSFVVAIYHPSRHD